MKLIRNTLIILGIFISTAVAAESHYSELIVFGDSLSDPGNVFAVTGEISTRPYNADNIPDAPYPIGGLTFSNGKTWAQQIAKSLKSKSARGPALRSPKFTNYAFGGARASASAGGPFDMSAQLGQYLANTGGQADSEALYIVFFGGNDIRDALVAFEIALQQTLSSGGTLPDALAAGQAAAQARLTDAITSIADHIMTLSSLGAQHFLIPNAPNMGLVPAILTLGSETSTLATQLSYGFNLALESTLSNIEMAMAVQLNRFDVFSLLTTIASAPESYGLSNTMDACLTPLVTKHAICKHPDSYLFWDGVHPSRAGHKLLADAVLLSLL